MTQAQLVKQASEIPVGGSEDEAKERVRLLFKKNTSLDSYKNLSADEIKQLEDEHEENMRWTY
jgi:hypothetical protein